MTYTQFKTYDDGATGLTLTVHVKDSVGATVDSQTAVSMPALGNGHYGVLLTLADDGGRVEISGATGGTFYGEYERNLAGGGGGGGGDDAATIYSYFTALTRPDVFKADVSGLSTFDPGTDTVTVGANNDKTGYSLTQTFPTNFSNLAIDGPGQVTAGNMRGTDGALTALPTIPTNWLTADGLASDAVVEIQNGLSTFDGDLSSLATATNLAIVDTVADAIRAKTDQLTFTVANQVDANALTGAGGDDSAAIYNYFTALTRPDVFKADVSGLSTFDPGSDTVIVGDKTGYSLAQAFPTNFDTLAIDGSGHVTAGNMRGTDGALTALPTVPTDWLTADGLASDAVVEIQNGLATSNNQTTILTHLTDIKGATFSGATDSLEAIRDRGDEAWATATGFSTTTNVTDAQMAIQSDIAALNDTSTGDIRAELSTELGRIDTEISSRLASASYTAPDNAGIANTLTAAQAAELAATASADGRFVIDYADSTATQYNANGTVRTVFNLRESDGITPATTAQSAVERVPQ
jgi:hypothetical protein